MLRLADILDMVAQGFGSDVAALCKPCKRRELVQARDAYAELARRFTPHSGSVIGKPLGASGHVVRKGFVRFVGHMKDPDFRARFDLIDAALQKAVTAEEAEAIRMKKRMNAPPCRAPEPRSVTSEFFNLKYQIEKSEDFYHG